jgi:hypothetical protein
VVEAADPAKVKFVDPIPAASSRSKIEDAAIQLSRKILNGQFNFPIGRGTCAETFVQLLVDGTSLDWKPTKQEREQEFFDDEKREELRRLARQEAKAERDAIKAAKDAAAKEAAAAKKQGK